MKILVWLLLMPITLFGLEYERPTPNRSKEHFSISVHPLLPKVNPITGAYVEEECDFVVAGSYPLRATRFYHSQIMPSSLYAAWQINPETFVKANFEKSGFDYNVLIGDEEGGNLLLEGISNGTYFFDPKKQKGVTNTGTGSLSAQTNPKNVKVTYTKLFDPKNTSRFQFRGTIVDGSGKKAEFHTVMHCWHKDVKKDKKQFGPEYWTPYYLMIDKVFLPNGLILEYNYVTYIDDKIHPTHYRIGKITLKSKKGVILGSLEFFYPAKKSNITEGIHIEGSDKRKFSGFITFKKLNETKFYFFDPTWGYVLLGVRPEGILQLTSAKAPSKALVGYIYDANNLLSNKVMPEGRLLNTEYEKARVKAQLAPVGPKDEMCKIGDYSYFSDHTDVLDAEGQLTRYHFDSNKLITKVEKFQGKDLIFVEKTDWKQGEIQSQSVEDAQGKVYKKVSFRYDERGNVLEETISGVGMPSQVISRTYSNDGFNLKLSESEAKDQITHYTYVPGTNLLATEFFYEKNTLLKRIFYFYDDDIAVCTRTIVDDGKSQDPYDLKGVTFRKILDFKPKRSLPCFGLPEQVEEKTIDSNGNEILLKKISYIYTPFGKVQHEDHYDATDKKCYSLHFAYDERENLVAQTDAEGHVRTYTYDLNNNLTSLNGPKLNQGQEIIYDKANRPRKIKEKRADGSYLVSEKEYDKLSRIIKEVDPCGNVTQFAYDALGRITTVIHPDGSIDKKEYDVLGNVTQEIDGEGYVTKKAYNYLGKPIEVYYPDGSFELFEYEANGNLSSHLDRNGAKTIYVFDALNHPIETKVYDPQGTLLRTTRAEYSSFCLLKSIDGEGIETTYEYDRSGRQVSEKCAQCQKEFGYDSLGNLSKTKVDETLHHEVFDFLGRVIEIRNENLEGQILKSEKIQYDACGNKTHTINSKGLTEVVFDFQNLPLVKKDPLGNVTWFDYEYQNGLTVKEKAPNGILRVEKKDFRGHVLETSRRDQKGNILQKVLKKYDRCGNQIEEEISVYNGKTSLKKIVNRWSYGPMNHLTKLIESDSKITQYEYDDKGRVSVKIKPDSVKLNYEYDFFGRLKRFYSDDFDYQYSYDKNNRLTKVEDKIASTLTTRTYNQLGKLTSETLANDLSLSSHYDDFGRKVETILPDETNIQYTYKNDFLFEVKRKNLVHTYLKRDLEGKIIECTLPSNQGTLSITWDPLARWKSFTSPYYTSIFQNDSYDSVGNLIRYSFVDRQGSINACFQYDDLNQMIKEDNHTYQYDSLQNRIIKDEFQYTINDLNQIVDEDYNYDKNGNLLSDGKRTFVYDSQDRLIEVKSDHRVVKYTYDPFHRRQTKEMDGIKELFLWDGDNEIGLVQSNIMTQLRVLGEGLGAEIGAAILYELDNQPYIPIHDHRGCLVELIGFQEEGETNRYTAYGEEATTLKKSPWRFCSKRFDEESGLHYFGRRYYSAALGRWLTADPEGFHDGPNLYAYVHNGPLTSLDLYGLRVGQLYGNFERTLPVKSYNLIIDIGMDRGIRPGFINGLNNTSLDAYNSGLKLAHLMGSNINLTYSACGGIMDEGYKALLSFVGIRMPVTKKLHETWDNFFSHHQRGIYLQYGHSDGVSAIRNALRVYSSEKRKRIRVIAIAPACFIDPDLCESVRHYVSKKDIVPWIDNWNRKKYKNTIRILKPHPNANFLDHGVTSPTYDDPIFQESSVYFKEMREYGF